MTTTARPLTAEELARLKEPARRERTFRMVSYFSPLLLLLAMSVLCWLLSEWVWRLSVRRYTSASS